MADITQPTRRCSRCGVVKPIIGGFYSDPKKKRCRTCLQAETVERVRKRMDYINAYKMARGCADCGWCEHPHALEFDHRPGEEKIDDVTKFRLRGTVADLIAEMKKCDVVCANCHRIRTAERRDFTHNAFWDLRRVVVVDSEAADLDGVLVDDQLSLFDDPN